MYNQGWEWCLKAGLHGKQNHNKKVILWELNQNLVNELCVCVCVCVWMLNNVQLFATPWTVAHQASLSMEFSR